MAVSSPHVIGDTLHIGLDTDELDFSQTAGSAVSQGQTAPTTTVGDV